MDIYGEAHTSNSAVSLRANTDTVRNIVEPSGLDTTMVVGQSKKVMLNDIASRESKVTGYHREDYLLAAKYECLCADKIHSV